MYRQANTGAIHGAFLAPGGAAASDGGFLRLIPQMH
jgi:hypothetical protein